MLVILLLIFFFAFFCSRFCFYYNFCFTSDIFFFILLFSFVHSFAFWLMFKRSYIRTHICNMCIKYYVYVCMYVMWCFCFCIHSYRSLIIYHSFRFSRWKKERKKIVTRYYGFQWNDILFRWMLHFIVVCRMKSKVRK